MRVLIMFTIAVLLPVFAFASDLGAGASTPSSDPNYADRLLNGEEIPECFSSLPHKGSPCSRVHFRAWAGETLLREGELEVLQSQRGMLRTFAMIRNYRQPNQEAMCKQLFYVDDQTGRTNEKVKAWYEKEAGQLAQLPVTRFSFAGLNFMVLVPGADRIEVSVDSHQVPGHEWSSTAPSLEDLQAARDSLKLGELHRVATYTGVLDPCGDVWIPMPPTAQ